MLHNKPTYFVMQDCTGEQVNVDKTTFVDVEEDIYGRDVMTYTCPECGEDHKALVTRG